MCANCRPEPIWTPITGQPEQLWSPQDTSPEPAWTAPTGPPEPKWTCPGGHWDEGGQYTNEPRKPDVVEVKTRIQRFVPEIV